MSGVCFDDSHDDSGIRTVDAGDHYPKATIIGGTDDVGAVRVIIGNGGTEHEVSSIVVEGWPERVFVADLPAGAMEVRYRVAMDASKIWSAEELEKMSPNERQSIVRAGFETDLSKVSPELLERTRRKIGAHIVASQDATTSDR